MAIEEPETPFLLETTTWLLIGFCLWVGYLFYVYYREKQTGIPMVRPIPFFGSFYNTIHFSLNYHKNYDMHVQRTKDKGLVWGIRGIIGPRFVMIVEPSCVEHILKTNFENYIKGEQFVERMQIFLGNGIFNTNGASWKKQRQVASHVFKVKELRKMISIFIGHGSHVLDIFKKEAASGHVIDVQELFMKFTLDSIGEIAFGEQLNALQHDIPFSVAFNQAQYSISRRFQNPLLKLLGPFAKYTPAERGLVSAMKVLDDFAYRIIEKKKGDPNLDQQLDLLSRYMTMTDEENKPFSDAYLRDIVMNILLAGRDTTSQTLTWGFCLLSENPRVEQKLIAEIDTMLGGKLPDYETLKEMKYLKAVIDEVLRLYPPVPVDPKFAVHDDVLPNGMKVPGGSMVAWSAWSQGRMEQFWDNPLEFRPERWFGENGGKEIHPYQFIPFQAGPRTCLGMRMAYLEVQTMLCMILQKYTLRLANGFTPHYKPSITLLARDGMKMTVHLRKQ